SADPVREREHDRHQDEPLRMKARATFAGVAFLLARVSLETIGPAPRLENCPRPGATPVYSRGPGGSMSRPVAAFAATFVIALAAGAGYQVARSPRPSRILIAVTNEVRARDRRCG